MRAIHLFVAVLAAGCTRTLIRGTGDDCSAVAITFREAPGGVGLEFVDLDGASGYIACSAAEKATPTLVEAWQNANNNAFVFHSAAVASVPNSVPVGAKLERKWTHPQDGVIYRYAEFTFVFSGCDFWYSPMANTKCAPPDRTPKG
jgi:hypothetical protein